MNSPSSLEVKKSSNWTPPSLIVPHTLPSRRGAEDFAYPAQSFAGVLFIPVELSCGCRSRGLFSTDARYPGRYLHLINSRRTREDTRPPFPCKETSSRESFSPGTSGLVAVVGLTSQKIVPKQLYLPRWETGWRREDGAIMLNDARVIVVCQLLVSFRPQESSAPSH